MTPNINTIPFKATGAPNNRMLGDRWADIINVKDYLPAGQPDGSTDNTSGLQAAIDAAFGTAGSPHGLSNQQLNRPVFFPNGKYILNSTGLVLTRVVGGYVFGAGLGSTILSGGGGTSAVITTDGCVNLVMERVSLQNGGSSSICLDLDWGGNTTDGGGLNNNLFRDCGASNCGIGVRIAHGGNAGYNNIFEHLVLSSCVTAGMDAQATSATDNVVILGQANDSGIAFYSSKGSIHLMEPSLSTNTFDVQVDSGLPVAVVGGRTENSFLKLTSGLVAVRGFALNADHSVEFANISGGRCSLDGCYVDTNGVINGGIATATGCSISGTTLTIGTVTAGSIAIGQVITAGSTLGTAGASNTSNSLMPFIISNISGSGNGSTWTLNYASGNVASATMTFGSMLYLRANNFVNSGYLSGWNGTTVQNI